jgi:hypothetical protein
MIHLSALFRKTPAVLRALGILAVIGLTGLAGQSSAQAPAQAPSASPSSSSSSPEALALVEGISRRIASYPELGSWQARALSTTSRMTADWKPKSMVRSEKIVSVERGLWSEEILNATETEDGRTRDVTAKLRAEARERAEKQRRSTENERNDEQRRRGRRSLDIARDEALPFGPDKRDGYDFALEGTTELDGTPVIVLRSRSHVRSQEKFEGLYFVDPATHDVVRAELTIAKKPGPLKRMEMEVDFGVLPGGHQVMKKAVMRIHVGLIVKNIRIEAVETYSDHVLR